MAANANAPASSAGPVAFEKMAAGVLFWPQLLEGQMDSEMRERLTHEVVQTFLARYRSASG